MKLLVISFVSGITLCALWLMYAPSDSEKVNTPSAEAEHGSAFLSANLAEAIPTSSSLPTTSATTSPSTSPSPILSATPTQLIPQITVTTAPSPTKTPTPAPTVSASATPTIIPTPSPTATPSGGIVIISLTTPIAQKQTATIQIQSTSLSPCTIQLTLPSGGISTSKDLGPKTTDEQGLVSWSWAINWNTKPGTAIIDLACTSGSQTYSGQTTMQIIAAQ